MESDQVTEVEKPTPAPALEEKKVVSKSSHCYLGSQATFRVLTAAVTMAATLVTAFSEQTNTFFGVSIHASYKSFLAFRFLLYGNAVALGYSLLSVPLVFCKGTRVLLNMLDMLAMGMLVGVASAASAIGWVGKKGNIQTGWNPVCQYYTKFCHRIEASIICTFMGSGFLLVAIAFSSINKKS